MPQSPDIAVYSREGKLLLIAEVKGATTTDADWAAHYRRNLFAHGLIPVAPYFLLIAPDKTYLWSHPTPELRPVAPTAEGNTKKLLARFLPKLRSEISTTGLEMAAQSWLRDLTERTEGTPANNDEKHLLSESGLIDNIRTGSLTFAPLL